MPHQCTNCGRTFADGSKEMLSGCPDCGGNKFQFRPAGASDPPAGDGDSSETTSAAPSPSTAEPTEQPNSDAPPETVADRAAAPDRGDGEDGAQASARSEVVSEDEIAAAAPERSDAPAVDAATAEADTVGADAAHDEADDDAETADPNLDALRQKLNDQFESIRIVSPGQYELNLMELYDREEYIISLREDGRYVIEMPGSPRPLPVGSTRTLLVRPTRTLPLEPLPDVDSRASNPRAPPRSASPRCRPHVVDASPPEATRLR